MSTSRTDPRATRVAIVAPRFPPDVGGLEQYCAWVARTLHKSESHLVTVVTTGAGTRSYTEEFEGIRVHRLGTLGTISNTRVNPAWWWQVPRLLRRMDVQVVNAHSPVPGLADVAALRSHVPVVLTYHAGSMVKGDSSADGVLRGYERHVLPRVFDRCHELVAVSPTALTHTIDRSWSIPPGVDTRVFSPGTDQPVREPRLLYVGRVESTSRWKGLDILVVALARVRTQIPEARLEVVGWGDDVLRLQSLARELGVADAITWSGHVEHDSLPGHYRRSSVVVLPSLTEAESFGMTLIEAMACGVAVVGSAVGGIPHVVRHERDGLLVRPGDPAELASALVRLLLDVGLREKIAVEARAAACDRWDWRHREIDLLDVIDRAAVAGTTRMTR